MFPLSLASASSRCVRGPSDTVPVWVKQESKAAMPRDVEWHGIRHDDCSSAIGGLQYMGGIHHRDTLLHRGFQERWGTLFLVLK